MNLTFNNATPGLLDWTGVLFSQIQALKAGTFDSSEVYQQFGWLIVPSVPVDTSQGPMTVYFAIKGGDDASDFSIFRPITQLAVWTSVDGAPVSNLLQIQQASISIAAVLAAGSAEALEALIFAGDDRVLFAPATPDRSHDTIRTWGGNDNIEFIGSGGTDRIYGGDGNDSISIASTTPGSLGALHSAFFGYGDAGNDTIRGADRGDRLFGGSGRDSLIGNGGDDTLTGGTAIDLLQGGAGNDRLIGEDGADAMQGGTGSDTMTGGRQADTFAFGWWDQAGIYDCGIGPARDLITDFTPGQDLIRLNEYGPDAITLIGTDAFTAANQVRWVRSGENMIIYINGDADLAAEMAITLKGVSALQESDFLI